MKKLISIIIALSLPIQAEWCESIEVHYFDSRLFPVPDATASARYQKNDYNAYDGFASAKTDLNGIARFSVCNYIPPPSENRSYLIAVSSPFGDSEERRTRVGENPLGTGGAHREDFFLPYALSSIRVRAVHVLGKPLPGVRLRMSKPYSAERITGEDGWAVFRLKPGLSFEVAGSYQGVSAGASRTIGGDADIELVFRAFNNTLDVLVLDLEGAPIAGAGVNISYSNITRGMVTDEGGFARFSDIGSDSVVLAASYNGVNASMNVSLAAARSSANISLDRNPLRASIPILNPIIDVSCHEVLASVEASDPRANASELNVSLRYSFGGPWFEERLLHAQGNAFNGSINCSAIALPANLSYYAIVESPWGVRESGMGNATLSPAQPRVSIEDVSTSGPIEEQVEIAFIGYITRNSMNLILGAIILVSVIALIVLFTITLFGKGKKGEEGAILPPPKPPLSRSGMAAPKEKNTE